MIDFVMYWVDGNDPDWRVDFSKYREQEIGDKSEIRFRDWDNLQYWFRGVEKFAPWVNKIHFITSGHLPKWLDVNHPKLNIVKHTDYIPNNLLPTFNSSVIELFIHKIAGLSEKFVLFNDDFFIINHIEESRFFEQNLPCDMAILDVIAPGDILNYNYHNNCAFINSFFNKTEVIHSNRKQWYNLKYKKYLVKNILLSPWKYFTGFMHPHFPQPFLKQSFEEVWNKDKFTDENFSRFRNKDNYTQYLMSSWQLVTNSFYPKNVCNDSLYVDIKNDNISDIYDLILKQGQNIVILNDSDPNIDFDLCKKQINIAFQEILPNPSSFEI